MSLAERYVDEKLGEHWFVDESSESFVRLLNHIELTTFFKPYFERAIADYRLYSKPEGLTVADLGAGVGWTSAVMALRPEIKKVFMVEPSKSRLKQARAIAKHFKVPEGKIVHIEGDFGKPNVPEKVDIVCMCASIHHCWDKDIPELFQNVRQMLVDESEYVYKDYQNKERRISHPGRVLIANEHYVTWLWILGRFFSWGKKFPNWKSLDYGPGRWRDPDAFSSEHWRTKGEMDAIFSKEGFFAEYVEHDGNLCDRMGPWRWIDKLRWKYYYAILRKNETEGFR